MFEIVQFVEYRPGDEAVETRLGECQETSTRRSKRPVGRGEASRSSLAARAYAWWVVREQGEKLARWIADNHSHKEFAVDVRSGALVEIRAPAVPSGSIGFLAIGLSLV